MALVVDEVRGVIDVPDERRMKVDTAYKPGYVCFAAPVDDGRLVMVLDPDKVFSDTDIVSLATIAAEANRQ